MDLTDTQHAILAFLAERIEADGFPPSQSEISRAFGFKGVRGAQYHLEALEAAGAIERRPGQATTGLRRQGSVRPQLGEDAVVLARIGDDADVGVVLGRRSDQRRTTDVDDVLGRAAAMAAD